MVAVPMQPVNPMPQNLKDRLQQFFTKRSSRTNMDDDW
jgi:hypothetical protein